VVEIIRAVIKGKEIANGGGPPVQALLTQVKAKVTLGNNIPPTAGRSRGFNEPNDLV